MDTLIRGFGQALQLILHLDAAVREIALLSLQVSGAALLLSILFGIPLGVWLGLRNFRGRQFLIAFIYTGMGLPPVVVGLAIYLMLSHQGPLGGLDWLFTPKAMITTQTILALPLVAGFTMTSIASISPEAPQQLRSLGATSTQIVLTLLYEARNGVFAAIVAGFGAIISEVGSVMLVGGNIEHHTRVLTTAIVLETRKGNFDLAIALGLILVGLTFSANWLLLHLQGRLEPRP
ncbi:MAG: ABC transporter permease subunit [Chloroflexi bacterium]|nr:ABC transporter permease subunit [Chloroflexota bacterium]